MAPLLVAAVRHRRWDLRGTRPHCGLVHTFGERSTAGGRRRRREIPPGRQGDQQLQRMPEEGKRDSVIHFTSRDLFSYSNGLQRDAEVEALVCSIRRASFLNMMVC